MHSGKLVKLFVPPSSGRHKDVHCNTEGQQHLMNLCSYQLSTNTDLHVHTCSLLKMAKFSSLMLSAARRLFTPADAPCMQPRHSPRHSLRHSPNHWYTNSLAYFRSCLLNMPECHLCSHLHWEPF